MKTTEYVTINNRAYDPITGLPVDGVAPITHDEAIFPTEEEVAVKSRGIAVPSVHISTQRSMTLNRRYVKHPDATASPNAPTLHVRNYSPITAQQLNAKRVAPVTKFKTTVKAAEPTNSTIRPAQTHPVVQRAANTPRDLSSPQQQRRVNVQKRDIQAKLAQPQHNMVAPKPAHILKNEAIAEAMSREVASQKKPRLKKQRRTNPFARFISITVPSLAVILLAGYFTYLSMPNLSIKMAAVQSGVDAKYPGYRPDGYALSGPISFRDGEVSMRFAYAADSGHDFTITQQRSNWNSATLKQMFSDTPENVTTTTIDGLTIYSQNGKAAWINSGILYTIDGQANLSNSQIQRMATSM